MESRLKLIKVYVFILNMSLYVHYINFLSNFNIFLAYYQNTLLIAKLIGAKYDDYFTYR